MDRKQRKRGPEVKVSVIIPVYNCRDYLEQCLNSVVRQSLQDMEIICIDDGSTDGSAEVIERFSRKDGRIILLRQSNQGAGKARNRGILNAGGKYLAFLDADDYYIDRDALGKMTEACETYDVPAAGSLRKSIDHGQEKNGSLFVKALGDREAVVCEYKDFQIDYDYQSFVFERKLLSDNRILFPDYRRFQDPPLLVRALYAAEKFVVVNTYLYCYRIADMASRFDSAKTADLMRGLTDNLVFAQERGLDRLFQKTRDRLEYEYGGIICHNMSEESLDILKLLLQANQVICDREGESGIIIQPLKVLLGRLSEDHKRNAEDYGSRLRQRISGASSVAVYGAGRIAKELLCYLRICNLLEKVSFVIVSERNGNADNIDGIPVIELKDYPADTETVILIAAGGLYHREIVRNLEGKGLAEYEIIDEVLLGRMIGQSSR